MHPLTDLIFRLHHKDTAIRYPNYAPDDGKTHLLYVGATLNGTSFYRIMLPAWTLNTTDTHSTIINDLRPWHNENRNIPFDMPFYDDMIRWAHYIIFPTIISSNQSFRQLLNTFRHLNPNVCLVMDIDDDYLQPSPYHPNFKSFTSDFKINLMSNLRVMDMITCTHQRLYEYYKRPISPMRFAPLPNLMTCLTEPQQMAPPGTREKANETIHLGLTVNRTQFEDLLTVVQPLKQLLKARPGRFKITLFGWDGKLYINRSIREALRNIPHQYIPPVLLKDYFATLHALQYDIALMPLCENNFNRMKSNHKLLQYAQMGVPVVAPDLPPYNEPPIPGRETLKYTRVKVHDGRVNPHEWAEKILYLADNYQERQNAGARTRETVLKNYFIEDPENIKIWQNCFAKPRG